MTGVTLVAWCSLFATLVCGGGIFVASKTWHTSAGECDHVASADQLKLAKNKGHLRHTSHLPPRRTLINNTETPAAKVLQCECRFIIIEACIKNRKVRCFVDGGAERSIILRKVH